MTPTPVPRASAADTAGALMDVLGPLVARGVIVRRPPVVGLFDRMDADRRAVRRMQRLRARYGEGPLLLAVPGRDIALVLDPAHVRRILAESPEPFATANREKVAALSHFQPHGVLISHGDERADRRRFNEDVLDYGRPVHRLAESLVAKLGEEADELLAQVTRSGRLTWDDYAIAWWRMVRRVTLGDRAREDHELTDMLRRLRGDANWAFAKPKRNSLRNAFLERLQRHLDRAEPGSLAELVASVPSTERTRPTEQVPQWLFAFDAAGMAGYRALALLDAHRQQIDRARGEIADRDLAAPQDLPFLRSCVLESVRLWPTTPGILRDTTSETTWPTGTLPRGAGVVIFVPFFHRDDERLPYADSFAPELWQDGRAGEDWPLVPFSAGPGECPGRDIVLLLTSSLIAHLLAAAELRQSEPRPLRADGPLPGTLSPFRLEFDASPRPDGVRNAGPARATAGRPSP